MTQLQLKPVTAPGDARADGLADGTVVVATAMIGAVLLALTWPKHQPLLGVLQAVLGLIACCSLLAGRARPSAVAAFTTTLALVSPMAISPALAAVTSAGRRCTPRAYAMLAAYVAAIAAAHVALHLDHAIFLSRQPNAVLIVLLAVPMGVLSRVQAARFEVEQRKRVEETRAAERRRIAREMHDVLAHRISMLSVHAGALEFHPDAAPEDIANAAGIIRASAHAALGELRDVISLLRSPADNGDQPGGGDLQRPQPTLTDVPQLIEESREAGMRISFEQRMQQPDAVPYAIGRTVYRIVQEGLTNARKHAPSSAVEVRIAEEADANGSMSRPATDGEAELAVSVVTRAAESADVLARAAPPGSGTGLIGLAERVTLAGGRLEHGSTPEGGYALKAILPVPR